MADENCIGEKCDRQQNKTDMLQCAWCSRFYHTECIGVTKKAKTLPFSCLKCRLIPMNIDKILQQVNSIVKSNKELQDEVTSLKGELVAMKNENKTIRENIATMNVELQRLNWGNFRGSKENQNTTDTSVMTKCSEKELVLGDSMLKFIDEAKLEDTKLVVIPGASIEKMTEELNKPQYHGVNLDRVTIMAGTTELQELAEEEDEGVNNELLQKYKQLISSAKAIAKNVAVSSICPRQDNCSQKVAPFNAGLEGLCQDNECVFVDHTKTFTLADNTINDGYLVGGVGPYLTKAGLNKVAKNFKLKLKENITDVTRSFNGRNERNVPHHRRDDQSVRRNVQGVRFNKNGCVLCNEEGHNASTCFHKTRGPVICRTCNIPGHKSKHHVFSY